MEGCASTERVFSTGTNVVTKKRTRMLPTKVEISIIKNKNQAKVEEFKKKTSLGIVKTKENALLDINIEEIVRAAEESLEGETDIFGSNDSEYSEDDYDKLSEESEDDK